MGQDNEGWAGPHLGLPEREKVLEGSGVVGVERANHWPTGHNVGIEGSNATQRERNDFGMIPNKEVRVHNSGKQNQEEDQFRVFFVCFLISINGRVLSACFFQLFISLSREG